MSSRGMLFPRQRSPWGPIRWVVAMLITGFAPLATHATAPEIPGYVVTQWGSRDGAPGDIRAMAQTKDGWLWLGTSSGLYRFDGRTFASHDLLPADAPGRHGITDLAALPDGELLVTYGREVVMRLAADGVTTSRPDGLPTDAVDGLLADGHGRAFADAGGHLYVLEGDHWTRCEAPGWQLPDAAIDGAALDADGALVVNTGKGVFRLLPGSKVFARVAGIDASRYNHLLSAPDGRMWRSKNNGFELLPGLRGGNPNPGTGSSFFAIDGRGGFWSMQQGCPTFCLRREGVDPAPGSMGNPALDRIPGGRDGITAMTTLSDRAGAVWVSGKEGLVRLLPTDVRRVDLGYEAYYFSMMPMDDGSMLVGAETNWTSDDLVRFTPTGRVTVAKGVHTHALARLTGGLVLHSGRNGPLSIVQGDDLIPWSQRPEKAENTVTLLVLAAGPGRAYVSIQDVGFFTVTPDAWTPLGPAAGFPTAAPSVAGTDGAARTWFGYLDGKVREVREGKVAEGGVFETGLGSVTSLLPGEPLVAGGENGLAWFDGTEFRPLHLRMPEALRGVTGLARTADGALWAYGRAGLVRLDPAALKAAMTGQAEPLGFRILTDADGLPGGAQQTRSFASLSAARDGRLWAAGVLGLATVDPDAVRSPAPVHPVILSMASGRNGPLAAEDPSIAPDDASLEVTFTGLSVSDPRHVQLRYRLRGADDTWQEANAANAANTVKFAGLAPGRYQFELEARGSEGDWSAPVTSRTITRTPAFTETALFRWLVGLAVVLVLAVLYKLRVRALRRRSRERTDAKLAERDRIARELHDSILQGIQAVSIRLSAWELDASVPETMRTRVTALARQMSGIVLEGRARVVALRSVGQGHMSLSATLDLIGEDHENDSEAVFELLVEGEEYRLPDAIQVPVVDILREAIHNAFMHAGASAITVTLDFSARTFRAEVADNGKGLPPEVRDAGRRPGHWGLVIMRERAEAMGATLEMDTGPAGTRLGLAVRRPEGRAADALEREAT